MLRGSLFALSPKPGYGCRDVIPDPGPCQGSIYRSDLDLREPDPGAEVRRRVWVAGIWLLSEPFQA